ncbi:TraX family protein [Clostridium boliviensis]
MIGALPFISLYNGGKGKSMKYFFYIFYPAHILIFFILSRVY